MPLLGIREKKNQRNRVDQRNLRNRGKQIRQTDSHAGLREGRETLRASLRMAFCMLTDIFWPPRCPLCDALRPVGLRTDRLRADGQDAFCPSCRRALPAVRDPWCMCCGRQLEEGEQEYCRVCGRRARAFDGGRIIFLYEGELRESVLRMKFSNRRDVIEPLAGEMAERGARFMQSKGPLVIVPIPMHAKKRRARGYDQSVLLARALGKKTGIPVAEKLLIRSRYTLPSKALGAEARTRNMRGAFSLKAGAVVPEQVLLVDDIYTTGTTMDEAARALKLGGVNRVWFITLCGVRE